MIDKRTYSELHRSIMRNISGLATDNADKTEALVNDIIEVYEDFERLRPVLEIIVGESSKEADVKSALLELNVWAWHTAEHLQSIFSILEEEWESQE